MKEKRSTLERLGAAMGSSNLRVDANNRSDVDMIIALGLSVAKLPAAASPLVHLQLAGSMTEIRRGREAVLSMVKRLNATRSWKLTGNAMRQVADLALAHHIAPACPHCHGRGYEVQQGTPALSERACSHCHGTGRRQVAKRHRDEIHIVIGMLERIDELTERAVKRALR